MRIYHEGFPKTSVFGKATLDLWGKAGFRPLFQEHFLKPTGFWEMLHGKKILLLIFVLSGPFSFGEELLGGSLGETFFHEQFLADQYTRRGLSNNIAITWYHYPENKVWGFFAQGLYVKNSSITVFEENQRESMGAREYDFHDLRFSGGPSFKWNITSVFFIPLSLGPVFSFYFENTTEYLLKDEFRVATDYLYTAISGGIRGDLALVLVPSPDFFLFCGFTGSWLFFRAEALRMRMNYRTTNNATLTLTRYSELDASLYIGIGLRIGSSAN
jgi:hypothetical protein